MDMATIDCIYEKNDDKCFTGEAKSSTVQEEGTKCNVKNTHHLGYSSEEVVQITTVSSVSCVTDEKIPIDGRSDTSYKAAGNSECVSSESGVYMTSPAVEGYNGIVEPVRRTIIDNQGEEIEDNDINIISESRKEDEMNNKSLSPKSTTDACEDKDLVEEEDRNQDLPARERVTQSNHRTLTVQYPLGVNVKNVNKTVQVIGLNQESLYHNRIFPGDVITHIDGHMVKCVRSLARMMRENARCERELTITKIMDKPDHAGVGDDSKSEETTNNQDMKQDLSVVTKPPVDPCTQDVIESPDSEDHPQNDASGDRNNRNIVEWKVGAPGLEACVMTTCNRTALAKNKETDHTTKGQLQNEENVDDHTVSPVLELRENLEDSGVMNVTNAVIAVIVVNQPDGKNEGQKEDEFGKDVSSSLKRANDDCEDKNLAEGEHHNENRRTLTVKLPLCITVKNVDKSVQVTDVKSEGLYHDKIFPGDIITHVDGDMVKNVKSFVKMMQNKPHCERELTIEGEKVVDKPDHIDVGDASKKENATSPGVSDAVKPPAVQCAHAIREAPDLSISQKASDEGRTSKECIVGHREQDIAKKDMIVIEEEGLDSLPNSKTGLSVGMMNAAFLPNKNIKHPRKPTNRDYLPSDATTPAIHTDAKNDLNSNDTKSQVVMKFPNEVDIPTYSSQENSDAFAQEQENSDAFAQEQENSDAFAQEEDVVLFWKNSNETSEQTSNSSTHLSQPFEVLVEGKLSEVLQQQREASPKERLPDCNPAVQMEQSRSSNLSTQPLPSLSNTAQNYFNQIKIEFTSKPHIYNEFLEIVKNIGGDDDMEIYALILRVSEMFRGKNKLLLGLNLFLPDKFQFGLKDLEEGGRYANESSPDEVMGMQNDGLFCGYVHEQGAASKEQTLVETSAQSPIGVQQMHKVKESSSALHRKCLESANNQEKFLYPCASTGLDCPKYPSILTIQKGHETTKSRLQESHKEHSQCTDEKAVAMQIEISELKKYLDEERASRRDIEARLDEMKSKYELLQKSKMELSGVHYEECSQLRTSLETSKCEADMWKSKFEEQKNECSIELELLQKSKMELSGVHYEECSQLRTSLETSQREADMWKSKFEEQKNECSIALELLQKSKMELSDGHHEEYSQLRTSLETSQRETDMWKSKFEEQKNEFSIELALFTAQKEQLKKIALESTLKLKKGTNNEGGEDIFEGDMTGTEVSIRSHSRHKPPPNHISMRLRNKTDSTEHTPLQRLGYIVDDVSYRCASEKTGSLSSTPRSSSDQIDADTNVKNKRTQLSSTKNSHPISPTNTPSKRKYCEADLASFLSMESSFCDDQDSTSQQKAEEENKLTKQKIKSRKTGGLDVMEPDNERKTRRSSLSKKHTVNQPENLKMTRSQVVKNRTRLRRSCKKLLPYAI